MGYRSTEGQLLCLFVRVGAASAAASRLCAPSHLECLHTSGKELLQPERFPVRPKKIERIPAQKLQLEQTAVLVRVKQHRQLGAVTVKHPSFNAEGMLPTILRSLVPSYEEHDSRPIRGGWGCRSLFEVLEELAPFTFVKPVGEVDYEHSLFMG